MKILFFIAALLVALTGNVRAGGPTEEAQQLENESYQVQYGNKTAGLARATAMLERALKLRESVLNQNSPELIGTLDRLAGLYKEAGAIAQATTLYQRSLYIAESTYGKNHNKVSGTLLQMCQVYYMSAAALACYQRAVEIILYNNNPQGAANILDVIAAIYSYEMDYKHEEDTLQRAIQIIESAYGKKDKNLAFRYQHLAVAYKARADYDLEEKALQNAIEIIESSTVENRTDMIGLLADQAFCYQNKNENARAEARFEQILKIYQALPDEQISRAWEPVIINSLTAGATNFRLTGNVDRAEALLKRMVLAREAIHWASDNALADPIVILALFYLSNGEDERAEPLIHRLQKSFSSTNGDSDEKMADWLVQFARQYTSSINYDRAEQLYLRAAQLLKSKPGPRSAILNKISLETVMLYVQMGKYDKADAFLERALQEVSRSTSMQFSLLQSAAIAYMRKSLYDRAEVLYRRAQQLVGPEPDQLMQSLYFSLSTFLAQHYQAMGLYDRAEAIYQKSLETSTGFDKKQNEMWTLPLMGSMYQAKGDYVRAADVYRELIRLSEVAYGKDSPIMLGYLPLLGQTLLLSEDYEHAEEIFQKLAKSPSPIMMNNMPRAGIAGLALGMIYDFRYEHQRALPFYREALKFWQQVPAHLHAWSKLPVRPLTIAFLLSRLAAISDALGEPNQATSLRAQALQSAESVPVENGPYISNQPFTSLAVSFIAQGHPEMAPELFLRDLRLSEDKLRRVRLVSTEARMTAFLESQRDLEEQIYSLVRQRPADEAAQRLGLATALLRKGRSLDEAADTSQAVLRSLHSTEDRAKFERLRILRIQIANLQLGGPSAAQDSQNDLRRLSDQTEQLEQELAERSAAIRAKRQFVGPGEIVRQLAHSLPHDGALIEIVAYRPFQFRIQPRARWDEPRYLAMVLLPDGRAHSYDLGLATTLDAGVTRFLKAIGRPQDSSEVVRAGQELHRLVMAPMEGFLANQRRLYLSLDGQLHLVPFAALHDGQDYLLGRYHFTYLTSGRDLLRTAQPVRNSQAMILADPAFDAPIHSKSKTPAVSGTSTPCAVSSRDTPPLELASLLHHIPALPGTRQEAEAVHRSFSNSKLLLGSEANEPALLGAEAPDILHVATHGLFLQDVASAPAVGSGFALPIDAIAQDDMRGLKIGPQGTAPAMMPPTPSPLLHLPHNPLLRSALVLAGAAAPDQHHVADGNYSDGLATALEVAGMNLWGTRLVVLSACDTGRGDVRLGQGVYGLRRAFFIAGAETLVTSLWKVNDSSTRDLMTSYYIKLRQGIGRGDAMELAAQAIRTQRPHPYFWAPFVVLGRDGPLPSMAITAR